MSAQAPATNARAQLRQWVPVILLGLIPALPLLVGIGLVNTRAGGDSPFLLVRVHQLVSNLAAGVFPVRWMPDAAYGLGYPFFNYYAALPYYLAALLKLLGLGYIASIKMVQALGFVLSAMAMYGLSRELRNSHAASLAIATLYACAPFHMVNVYVRGDSLSEFYAFVFFPLILWTLTRLHHEPSARNVAWVGLSYAGLILSHNLSAFIFSLFALLYVLLLAASSPAPSKAGAQSRASAALKHLGASAAALGLGLLLSAWFWIPALGETAYVDLRDMTSGYFHYGQHFRSSDLVQQNLLFDYAITADREPFRMGLLQALLALAGGATLAAKSVRQRRIDIEGAFVALLTLGATLMVTPLSQRLWQHLPLLPMVQFPWRFLSLQAIGTSLLAAYLIPRRPRLEWVVALVVVGMALVSALGLLQPERLHISEADVNTERILLYEHFTANIGTTIRADWLPAGVDPRPYTSEALRYNGQKPAPLVLDGQVSVLESTTQGPTSEGWHVDVTSEEAWLGFHTYYFPGWKARVDGAPAQIDALPGLGYINLRLTRGPHDVLFQLGETPLRRIGTLLSAVAAVLAIVALLRGAQVHQGTVLVALVAVGVVASLSVAWHVPPVSPQLDETYLDLTMDFDRVPYLHHNPGGVSFGSVARMSHYALSAQQIQAGESLTVSTFWDDVQAEDLRVEVALVSPAQHLFGLALREAVDAQPLTTDRTQHTLQVPPSTPRGLYLLALCLHDSTGEVLPTNTRGETLGTTYLVPVLVEGYEAAEGDEPTLQTFSDRIALAQVETQQRVAGTLEVTLTWRVDAPPLQDYKTALRLRDPAGWEVARLDTQPGYGFYPTHMWRPGEHIRDRYLLHLDEGTPPGRAYRLDVTLYDARTIRPLATATVTDIDVALPTVQPGLRGFKSITPALAVAEAQPLGEQWEQGQTLQLWVKWVATGSLDHDYRCQVSLRDATDAVALRQVFPLAVGYGTSRWPQNAVVASRYALTLPPDISSDEYSVLLSVMDPTSQQVLGTLDLGTLRIAETVRRFEVPPMAHAVGADFGDQVRLLGYDLQQMPSGLRLVLHWQALTAVDTDYKVFVHLFEPASEAIAAQQDLVAGREGYGSTRWLPQEIVSQDMVVPLEGVQRGDYRLAVGLYHNAGRLPIVAPLSFTVSADRLLLNQTIRVP